MMIKMIIYMFNERLPYSIPQFLTASFQDLNYNERVYITMKQEKKDILDSSITFPARYYSNYINIFTYIKIAYFHYNRKFHLFVQLSYTKISYLCKNTHLSFAERYLLHFRLNKSLGNVIRKYDISVKRKHTKTNENMNFSVLFTNFRKTNILYFRKVSHIINIQMNF